MSYLGAEPAQQMPEVGTGTVETQDIQDGAVTAAKLAAGAAVPSQASQAGKFLTTDGTTASWATVTPPTATAVSDQNNTSTGYFDLPTGTTAQRPGSPAVGMLRFNTTTDALETYSSSGWAAVTVGAPVLNSVSGYVVSSYSTTLTILGSNFGSSGTVRFVSGSTSANVSVTPLTQTSISVVVPAVIYGLTPGSTITISYINAFGQLSTNGLNVDIAGLPTGGTITTYGNYRVHTFTTSGNFISGVGFVLPTDWLIVAGGGAGGWDVGGGGGAGGYIYQAFQSTTANTTYGIVIGAGGTGTTVGGGASGSGVNTTAKGYTAVGGGGGGNYNGGNGVSGGSGGGGSGYGATTFGGSATSGQGNAGGNSVPGYSTSATGGGGGGAGGVGAVSTNNLSSFAEGGAGTSNSITGTPVTYAAGGKGGGDSWAGPIQLGAANTGTGGDGAGNPNTGGNGGSGVVIVRYQIA